ncbi:hypothetical protein [Prochlorococcus sp. MIT 1307]|uniref:hypothetical protein n=1 Tax=Prochlorococcus sp. MIT 1307 TaxID=3096219 RepID=UPI002A761701|nr:hypothetical protein [Prochlorococcus sp. MIT 1307]
MPRFFANNRRDGARLISSALLILTIAFTQLNHLWGQLLGVFSMTVCIYWALAYQRLDS